MLRRFGYDGYGNQIAAALTVDADQEIRTETAYDPDFHLYPVKVDKRLAAAGAAQNHITTATINKLCLKPATTTDRQRPGHDLELMTICADRSWWSSLAMTISSGGTSDIGVRSTSQVVEETMPGGRARTSVSGTTNGFDGFGDKWTSDLVSPARTRQPPSTSIVNVNYDGARQSGRGVDSILQ